MRNRTLVAMKCMFSVLEWLCCVQVFTAMQDARLLVQAFPSTPKYYVLRCNVIILLDVPHLKSFLVRKHLICRPACIWSGIIAESCLAAHASRPWRMTNWSSGWQRIQAAHWCGNRCRHPVLCLNRSTPSLLIRKI